MIYEIKNSQLYDTRLMVVKSGSTVSENELVAVDTGAMIAFSSGSTALFGVSRSSATGDGALKVPVTVFDRNVTLVTDWTGSAPAIGSEADYDVATGEFLAGTANATVIAYDSTTSRVTVAINPAVLLISQ